MTLILYKNAADVTHQKKDFAGMAHIPPGMREQLMGLLPLSLERISTKEDVVEYLKGLGVSTEFLDEASLAAFAALFEKVNVLSVALETTQKQLNEVEKLVDIDELSGIPNRRAFLQRLEWSLAMFSRYGQQASIVFFDLNHFKVINDTYGHAAGDEAIRHVSGLLLRHIRSSDFVARLSGDEFAAIMYYAKPSAAERKAAKLKQTIAETPLEWEGQAIHLTLAAGVYALRPGDTSETALSRADEAMYEDKRALAEAEARRPCKASA